MEDEKPFIPTNLSVDTSSPASNPYNLLVRQSRKLGGLAARTYDVTREFLQRPQNPDTLLFGEHLPGPDGVSMSEVDKVKNVVKHAHEVLAGAKTVILPNNLFADQVIVDRSKVTIIKRTFFWNAQVITTRIEDILGVTSALGPFFGSLTISTRIMNSTDHYEINYFWRKDAEYLKQIIQGYVIAQHNKIETKHMSRNELIDTLLELGKDSKM